MVAFLRASLEKLGVTTEAQNDHCLSNGSDFSSNSNAAN